MDSVGVRLRTAFFAILLSVAVLGGTVAQEEGTDTGTMAAPWQEVITGQVQAFRDHDATAALSFAARGFQTAFASPEAFFVAIVSSGYAPIMESRSHSFGAYEKVGETGVAQLVRFIGTDLQLYEAIYVLTEEEQGWRVAGVQLAKQPGVGI